MLGIITYPLMKITPKAAFISPFGKYEYLKVPIVLAQAPMHFQELMNKVLKLTLYYCLPRWYYLEQNCTRILGPSTAGFSQTL